jgi:hypothetical protein
VRTQRSRTKDPLQRSPITGSSVHTHVRAPQRLWDNNRERSHTGASGRDRDPGSTCSSKSSFVTGSPRRPVVPSLFASSEVSSSTSKSLHSSARTSLHFLGSV